MKLTIIGASGHGKVVAYIAKSCGYDEIVFLDDDEAKLSCGGYPVIGKTDQSTFLAGDVFVAIGDAKRREEITDSIDNRRLPTLIHPNAVIADDVEIGGGSVIMAGVVIHPGTVIGKGCIINTASSVDHDCIIGDYVHVSVGAHLSGTVTVGSATWIGVGATVNNNIDICSGCMIGAGAVVVDCIEEPGTYIGVPARRK